VSTVPGPGAARQSNGSANAGPIAGVGSAAPAAAAAADVVQHPSTPIPDIIPGIIPAKSVTLLAGAAGVGKTTLIAEWCARARDGRSIFGHAVTKPTFVGVLVADRKWSSHRQWFDAAGFADIPHYSYQDDLTLDWNRFLVKQQLIPLLEHGLNKLQAPRGSLIVVDPISMFVPGNLIDYKTTAIGLGWINRWVEAAGITIVGTAHMSKQKGDSKDRYKRPQDRILGSAALAGFTDTQMYLLGPEDLDEEYYGFGWIPHHAPAATYELTRDVDTGLFIPYFNHDKDQDLLGILNGIPEETNGIPTKDVIDFAGETLRLPRSTVYRYLQELKKLTYLKQPKPGRWYRVGPVPSTVMRLADRTKVGRLLP
jgi:hypothetical protein